MSKILILLISVLILSACSDYQNEYKQCVQEKNEIETLIKKEKAERDAAFAEFCDFVIPVCSENAVRNGRDAINNRISPNPDEYALLITIKAAGFAVVISLALFVLYLLYIFFGVPAKKARDDAIQLVRGSELKADKMVQDATAYATNIRKNSEEQKKIAAKELFCMKEEFDIEQSMREENQAHLDDMEQTMKDNEVIIKIQDKELFLRKHFLELAKYPYEE